VALSFRVTTRSNWLFLADLLALSEDHSIVKVVGFVARQIMMVDEKSNLSEVLVLVDVNAFKILPQSWL
jgi:hypothetical protein